MKKVLIKNLAQIATPTGKKMQKGSAMAQITCISDGAVYIEDGIIRKVGQTAEVCAGLDEASCQVIDGRDKCAVPGFVDSHTHFIFGGYRPKEFIRRLEGAGYLEIMQMGGGIQATVDATRSSSYENLYENGKKRLNHMLEQGITTVEGKSGYGLDFECERKQLQVMKELNEKQPVDIVPTYLGGHAVPLEYKEDADGYIDYMIEKVLPRVKAENLAEFCDIFCEDSVFSIAQSERLLNAAKKLGFISKIHADEIVTLGGAELAARLGAASADHLLMISNQGIKDLSNSDTVATLLPCTAFCLDKPYAPARRLIDSGCAVALASDFNPGSCFANSIPLMLALAVIHMKMSIEEAICALTLNGAAALKRADILGSIEVGKQADINIIEYPDYRFLVYHTDANLVEKVIKGGELVYEK
ncbi:MAG: imidazolonepropionase [Lachnospiraceae bacterium]|jgi:imidazolonepropionase|nr:imidazolonepropionase [Lachnospiraceae bacterium]MDD3615428.1 imidazolonepropionase [Lachnospiraceae bacterium]